MTYKEDLKQVRRETPRSIGTFLWIAISSLVVLILIGWGLRASGIISMNIQREVVQQSQQYTETKVSLLLKLHSDWNQLESEIAGSDDTTVKNAKRAQQKNIVSRMRVEAARISNSEVPQTVATFIATH